MKVKYFKNYGLSTDCYVGQNEKGKFNFFRIVYLSKNYFGVFANDESSSYSNGRLEGFYGIINIDKRNFKKLKKLANDGNRKEGSVLLKKIHEKNPDKNPNAASMGGDLRELDFERIHESYIKAEPILE